MNTTIEKIRDLTEKINEESRVDRGEFYFISPGLFVENPASEELVTLMIEVYNSRKVNFESYSAHQLFSYLRLEYCINCHDGHYEIMQKALGNE